MEATPNPETLLARYAEGPALLASALAGLGDDALDAPPPGGGWTIRQIAHHIVDGDDLWKTCIKGALGESPEAFSLRWYAALPQRVWSERWAYAQRPLEPSLALFRANRAHILQLLAHVPGGWDRAIGFRNSRGEVEPTPVSEVIQDQGDHVFHHVDRILALRRELGR